MKTENFESWEVPARFALSDQGIGYHQANPIIADAQAHCEFSGQHPVEAFGSPTEFARTVAAENPHLRQNVDRNGMLPADYLSGGAFALVALGMCVAIFYAILKQTLSFPATPAILVGLTLVGLAKLAMQVPDVLRAAGRPRLAPWGFALVGLLVLVAATSFMLLPREPVIRIPVLGIVVVALLLLWLMTRPSAAPKEPIEFTPPTPRTPVDDDTAVWCRRLAGLLVGRYDLPAERAAELAGEARDHLTAAGTAPIDEFGPVEEYARELAEHEPQRKLPFWRTTGAELVGTLVAVHLGASAFFNWLDEGHRWAAYGVALPGTLAAVWIAIRLTLRLVKRRSPTPA